MGYSNFCSCFSIYNTWRIKMFGWFKKPKAVITITRTTGTEEATQITVNANEADRETLFNAVTEAGEALRLRLISNNKIAQLGLDASRKTEKELGVTKGKPGRVKK